MAWYRPSSWGKKKSSSSVSVKIVPKVTITSGKGTYTATKKNGVTTVTHPSGKKTVHTTKTVRIPQPKAPKGKSRGGRGGSGRSRSSVASGISAPGVSITPTGEVFTPAPGKDISPSSFVSPKKPTDIKDLTSKDISMRDVLQATETGAAAGLAGKPMPDFEPDVKRKSRGIGVIGASISIPGEHFTPPSRTIPKESAVDKLKEIFHKQSTWPILAATPFFKYDKEKGREYKDLKDEEQELNKDYNENINEKLKEGKYIRETSTGELELIKPKEMVEYENELKRLERINAITIIDPNKQDPFGTLPKLKPHGQDIAMNIQFNYPRGEEYEDKIDNYQRLGQLTFINNEWQANSKDVYNDLNHAYKLANAEKEHVDNQINDLNSLADKVTNANQEIKNNMKQIDNQYKRLVSIDERKEKIHPQTFMGTILTSQKIHKHINPYYLPKTEKIFGKAGEIYQKLKLIKTAQKDIGTPTGLGLTIPGIKVASHTFEYTAGLYRGIKEHPYKAGLYTVGFTAATPIIGLIGKGAGAIGSTPFVSNILWKAPPVIKPIIEKAAVAGLVGLYGHNIYRKVKPLPEFEKSRMMGEITSTEIAPMIVGSYIGSQIWQSIAPGLHKVPGKPAGKKIYPKQVLEKMKTGEKIGYPSRPVGEHMKLFQTTTKRLPGQTEKAIWHATGLKWKKISESRLNFLKIPHKKGEVFYEALPGKSETPGLFGAHGVNPTFLRIDAQSYSMFRLPTKLFPQQYEPIAYTIYHRGLKIGKTKPTGKAYLPLTKTEIQAQIHADKTTHTIFKQIHIKPKYKGVYKDVEFPILEIKPVGVIKKGIFKTFGKNKIFKTIKPTKIKPIIKTASSYKIIAGSLTGSSIGVAAVMSSPYSKTSYKSYSYPSYSAPSISSIPSYSVPSYTPSSYPASPSKTSYPPSTPSYPPSTQTTYYHQYTPVPPIITPLGILPLGWDMYGRKKKVKKKMIKKKYQPSLGAFVLGITAPISKIKKIEKRITGFELRPMFEQNNSRRKNRNKFNNVFAI